MDMTGPSRWGRLCHPTHPLIYLAGKPLVMVPTEKADRLAPACKWSYPLLPQRKSGEEEEKWEEGDKVKEGNKDVNEEVKAGRIA